MKPVVKTIWVFCFAAAMGYLEAAVVVYLRAIYYPEGFNFPLKAMSQALALTEMYREAATLVMILAVGIVAAKYWLHRFAWFLFIFGIWDIAYYVFLKVLLGWPDSLFTTDILFLLPSLWTGPVIAPVINSLTMIGLAVVILLGRKGCMPVKRLSGIVWSLLIAGSIVILYAYTRDFIAYVSEQSASQIRAGISSSTYVSVLSTRFVPGSFAWMLFGAGLFMHLAAMFLVLFPKGKPSR